jgi:20S proteasome alpha/beta subunit
MTVVIGLLGSNGAVIGADTQLTAGNIKATATKVIAARSDVPGPTKSLAIGGAGDYGYFQALRLKLCTSIIEAMDASVKENLPFNTNIVEDKIKSALLPFYNESIMPFYQCPEDDRPDVYTINALWARGAGSLWCTDKMSVRLCVTGYDSTGYGSALANEYLHGLYRAQSPVESLALLGIYVIWHVKRLLNLVGHETEIVLVGEGVSTHLDRTFIQAVEQIFVQYASAQASAFSFVTGLQDGSEGSKAFATVRALLDKARQDISAIMSSSSQTWQERDRSQDHEISN